MSNKSEAGPPVLAALGIVLAVVLTPAGAPAAALLFNIVQGFALGFSVGALLFPPEIEQEDPQKFDLPDVTEGISIPVAVGRTLLTSPTIAHFDPEQVRSLSNPENDQSYNFWGPMGMVLCMSENSTSEYGDSLGIDGSVIHKSFFSLGAHPVKTLDGGGADNKENRIKPWVSWLDRERQENNSYLYYIIAAGGWSLMNQLSSSSVKSLAEIEDALSVLVTVQGSSGSEVKSIPLNMDFYWKSWPLISWGGVSTDFKDLFESNDWHPKVAVDASGDEVYYLPYNPGEAITWPDELPPLKGCLVVASPVWDLDKNTSSVPAQMFEVDGVYSKECGSFYLSVLTNRLWGMGLDVSMVSVYTFTGATSAAQVHFASEGLEFNGKLETKNSVRSYLEALNFHTASILRSDHLGRIELLPLRSLSSYGYSSDLYNTWLDTEDAPDTGGSYQPGYPVIWDVYNEDQIEIEVSNQGWGTTFNDFTATFDREESDYKNVSLNIKNAANKERVGAWVEKEVSFPLFSHEEEVNARLQILAKQFSRPGAIVKITLTKKYHRARVGDGLRIFSEEHGIRGEYFRILDLEDAKLGENAIEITASLDLDSLYATAFFEFSMDLPAQDVEPETPDDPNDPQALCSFTHQWPSNFAFLDPIALQTDVLNRNVNLFPNAKTTDSWTSVSTISLSEGYPDSTGSLTGLVLRDTDVSATGSAYIETQTELGQDTYLTASLIFSWFEIANCNFCKFKLEQVGGHDLEVEVNFTSVENPSVNVLSASDPSYVIRLERVCEGVDPAVFTGGTNDFWYLELSIQSQLSITGSHRVTITPAEGNVSGVNNVASRGLVILDSLYLHPGLGVERANFFKTEHHTARGASFQQAFRYAADVGPLNPLAGEQLPAAQKGNVVSQVWGTQFTLLFPIIGDEYRYSWLEEDGGLSIYLAANSFTTQDLSTEPWFGTKTDLELETDDWVLVVIGRPGIDIESPADKTKIEVLRFRKISKVDSSTPSDVTYKIEGAIRSCNKAPAFDWAQGVECWIVNIGEDIDRKANLPWLSWAHRSMTQDVSKSEPDGGHWRVRHYTQSIIDLGSSEIGDETEQAADEGLARTYDAFNGNFFTDKSAQANPYAQTAPSIAERFGSMEAFLWYSFLEEIDQYNVIIAPDNFLDPAWVNSGAGLGLSANVALSPFTLDLTADKVDINILASSNEYLRQNFSLAGLANGEELVLYLPIKQGTIGATRVRLWQVPNTGSSPLSEIRVNWDEFYGTPTTSNIVIQGASPGAALIEKINDEWYTVILTLNIETGIGSTSLRLEINPSATPVTDQGSVFLFHPILGKTSELRHLLPREGDVYVQMAPFIAYGGIGDGTNKTGQAKKPSWPDTPTDFPWNNYPSQWTGEQETSLQSVLGSYLLRFYTYTEGQGEQQASIGNVPSDVPWHDPINGNHYELSVGKSDTWWPTFRWTKQIQQLNGVVDDAIGAGAGFDIRQVFFRIVRKLYSTVAKIPENEALVLVSEVGETPEKEVTKCGPFEGSFQQ